MVWNKVNLMTTSKGDKLKCSNCGRTKWHKALIRPDICKICKYDHRFETAKVKKSEKPKKVMHGCWSSSRNGHLPVCSKCEAKLIPVPREGHPNSVYWRLERDDGMSLFACETCPE